MKPEVGQWYRCDGVENRFEVVAVDEDSELIEIQYEDGSVEEWELEDWDFELHDGNMIKVDAPVFSPDAEDEESFESDDEYRQGEMP